MAVTILEALQNANYNLQNNGHIGYMIARDQVLNSVTLLDKGYPLDTLVEDIIDKYKTLENIPDYGTNKTSARSSKQDSFINETGA